MLGQARQPSPTSPVLTLRPVSGVCCSLPLFWLFHFLSAHSCLVCFPLLPPVQCGSVRLSLVSSRGVTFQGIATGKYHAAVLTNSAEWEAACVKAGRKCGDLVHPLVYCPELHFSEFTSAVADMKNSVAVGLARPPRPGVQNKLSPALREAVSSQETAARRPGSPQRGPRSVLAGASQGGMHFPLGSLPACPPWWVPGFLPTGVCLLPPISHFAGCLPGWRQTS